MFPLLNHPTVSNSLQTPCFGFDSNNIFLFSSVEITPINKGMNRAVLQSSPVQQMMAANPNNWWNINTMRPPPPPPSQDSSPFFSTPSSFLTPHNPSSSLPLPSWHDNNQELPESWSQLLM